MITALVPWIPAIVLLTITTVYGLRRIRFPARAQVTDILFGRPARIPEEDFGTPVLGRYYRYLWGPGGTGLTIEEQTLLEGAWTPPDWATSIPGIPPGSAHPTAVARDGLQNFTRALETGDDRFGARCLAAADWLVEHQGPSGEFRYEFPWKGQESGWVSGLGQGAAVSTLTRAHQISGQHEYLTAASRALEFMLTSVQGGGTLGTFADGSPVVEEYPGLPDLQPQVLNGAVSAYFGICDYVRVTGDEMVSRKLAELVDSLKVNLWRYSAAPLSRYNTRNDSIASLAYHRMHIEQLRAIARISGDESFTAVADQFAGQVQNPMGRLRLLFWSVRFKGVDTTFYRVLALGCVVSMSWLTHAAVASQAAAMSGNLAVPDTYWTGALLAIVGMVIVIARSTLARLLGGVLSGATPKRTLALGAIVSLTGAATPLL